MKGGFSSLPTQSSPLVLLVLVTSRSDQLPSPLTSVISVGLFTFDQGAQFTATHPKLRHRGREVYAPLGICLSKPLALCRPAELWVGCVLWNPGAEKLYFKD